MIVNTHPFLSTSSTYIFVNSHIKLNTILWLSSYRIALGEFNESNIEELKRLTQGEPVLIWNIW
jgi:hypothetical protein